MRLGFSPRECNQEWSQNHKFWLKKDEPRVHPPTSCKYPNKSHKSTQHNTLGSQHILHGMVATFFSNHREEVSIGWLAHDGSKLKLTQENDFKII